MSKGRFVTGYRLLFAALTLGAIGVQFSVGSRLPNFNPINFFSYFTILSDVFAAGVFLFAGQ